MFTDHMLFSAATELFGILVILYSFAMSIRVQILNPILVHPTPGSWAPLNTFYFFAVRNCGNCDLFPAGRRTSANGKEETSC